MLKQFSGTRLAVFVILSSLVALWVVCPSNAAQIDEFIPADSILYVTIHDLEAVWETIEASENWQAIFDPSIQSQISELNQAMGLMELLLGTGPLGLVKAFGHQITFTLFSDDSAEPMIGVVVNTHGTTQEAERIVTGLAQLAGLAGDNRVEPYAGTYQEIEYHIVQIDQLTLTYGFVDEFLVVGFTSSSFGALIDTYKKQRKSIQSHAEFRQLYEEFAGGRAFAYLNMDAAVSFITANLADASAEDTVAVNLVLNDLGLASFQTLVCGLNLLEGGDGIQLYAQIKPSRRNGILGLLLKEGQPLQSIQGLSGTEDFFIALSPANSEAIWHTIEMLATTGSASGEFYDSIAAIEGFLNLDVEEYIVGALTGEVAAWGNFSESIETFVDPAIVIGLKNRVKWNAFLDSIQNIENLSVQHYEYRGTTLYQLPLPPEDPTITAHYGELKNLFLIGFSNERLESVVNNTLTGREASPFEEYLKSLPADPIFLSQLSLDRFLLAVIEAEGKSSQVLPNAAQRLRGTDMLTSLSVKGNEVWLKIGVPSEATVEVLGKVAALIVPATIE